MHYNIQLLIFVLVLLLIVRNIESYQFTTKTKTMKKNNKNEKSIISTRKLSLSSSSILSDNGSIMNPYQKNQLYFMHFSFAFTSRMWDMAIILLIADITNNSLKITAISGLMSSALSLIMMPKIGIWLDNVDRLKAAKTTLFYKFISISLAYLLCAYLSYQSGLAVIDSKIRLSLFYLLPILYSIASVSFATITQQIETDWLVVLANKDENWLRDTNSFLSQIDLGCKAAAPAVTGLLFAKFSQSNVSLLLVGINTIVTAMLYKLLSGLYNKFPNLTNKKQSEKKELKDKNNFGLQVDDDNVLFLNKEWDSKNFIGKFLNSFKSFATSGCAGLMVAYSFLYLTVLSFGSLMTVYLRSTGMNQSLIGTFKGLAALTEFSGAAMFPFFSRKFGDWKTGYFAIWYQFIFVLLAASSIFVVPLQKSSFVIAISVLLSRAGLWMFDLTTRQIAQVTIKETTRGRVNGQWKSMISFFDMFGYFLAVLFSRPDQFWVLTTISACMVGSAAIAYTANIPSNCNIPYRINNFFPSLKFVKRKQKK